MNDSSKHSLFWQSLFWQLLLLALLTMAVHIGSVREPIIIKNVKNHKFKMTIKVPLKEDENYTSDS